MLVAAIIVASVVLVAVIALAALSLYGKAQMKKIPEMSFEDCINYTLKDNENGVITVGVIEDAKATFTVYGENGKVLPAALHTYEIGSLTKTFTAALIAKAAQEGKIDINKTLDCYLDLPSGNSYPTISEVLTHTSGLKPYYFAPPMVKNFLSGKNDFYGITGEMALDKLAALSIEKADYPFNYSNYGYAVLGLVLESVYGESYASLVNSYSANELGLSNTFISNGGDLGGYWDWSEGDAYMSAGALTSDIEDMLRYAELMLEGYGSLALCQEPLSDKGGASAENEMMGIRMDAVGMAWIIDKENGVIWHNGGTGGYNSYLGFCPESGRAVVILANTAPNYRIPVTVAGIKLLKEMAG